MEGIDNKVGFVIHKLDVGMKRILDAKMRAVGYDEVTLMHGWILKYLYDNRDREVYQKDIEKQFSVGRSTVTMVIKMMEKRELVCRESVRHDARLKKVVLTPKGYCHHEQVEQHLTEIHKGIMEGITDEEKKLFLHIVKKMEQNLAITKTELLSVGTVAVERMNEEE